MQDYYVIEFTGINTDPDYSSYAYQSGDSLSDGASALTCKRWKTSAGAEKALLKMKRESDYLFEKYKDVRVVTLDESDIESTKAAMELRKFETDFDYVRRKAETYERTLKSRMHLRRAEALVALKEGDAILYYPDGCLGKYELQKIDSIGISTLQVAGKSFDRVHGRCLGDKSYVLPNLESLRQYFESYAIIQEFASANWDDVPVDVLLKFSDALSKVEHEISENVPIFSPK